MAEQPPPSYPEAAPEDAQLAGKAGLPSALPPNAQHASSKAYPPQYSASAYPPPPAGAQGQPLYPPQSTQPAPYPSPPTTEGPTAGVTGFIASAPPSSMPAGQVTTNVGSGVVTYSVPPPSVYGPGANQFFARNSKVGLAVIAFSFICFGISICVMIILVIALPLSLFRRS